MGAEFLETTKRPYAKYVDKRKVMLATPDLFTSTPVNQLRSYIAVIDKGVSIGHGDRLIAESHGSDILLVKGNSRVGKLSCPPQNAYDALNKSGGLAGSVVRKVNALSGTAEVTLC
jgi:hypothetical protein